MIYPFLTLKDETEIVHSHVLPDGAVKVYMERPDETDGFHHATCYLPNYQWEDIFGYSEKEVAHFQEIIKSNAHLILQAADKPHHEKT